MKRINIFEDDLTKADVSHLNARRGARAILQYNDQFVIIYNKNWNLYTLPGGGINDDESPEAALQREVLEETGFKVKNIKKTVILTEHFRDSIWEHHFFLCEADGDPQKPQHTKEERAAGMEVHIVPLETVLSHFSEHQTDHHHADAIYQREFLGFINSLA